MRRPLVTLATAVCSLLVSLAAPSGADARARLEGLPAEVRSGERIEVRWRDLDADVHEVELELSLGGARWVRISPEMEALEGHFTWRVPAGLSGPARLRLRAGGGHGEREVAEQELRILDAGASGPGASLGTPGWWDLEPEHGPAASGLFGAGQPVMVAGCRCAEAVTVSVPSDERATGTLRTSSRRSTPVSAPQVFARGFVAPRQSPLRN
jgi:hypothetical protein